MDALSALKVASAALLYLIQSLAYSLLAEYGLVGLGDKDLGLTVVALTSTVALLALVFGVLVGVLVILEDGVVVIEDDLFCNLVNARDFWVAKLPLWDLTIALPLSALILAISSSVLWERVFGLLEVDTALSILPWSFLPLLIWSNTSVALEVICCLFTFVSLVAILWAVVVLDAGDKSLDDVVDTALVTGTVACQFTLLSPGFTLLLVKIPFTSVPFRDFDALIFSILLTLLTNSWDFLNLFISVAPLFFNALAAFGIAHLPNFHSSPAPWIAPLTNPSSTRSPSTSWEAETVSFFSSFFTRYL